MSSSTLIVNARLVNEGQETQGDLRIADGRIAAIAPQLAARDGETVVDAAGRWLLPGMIDDQVHFREPGLTHKGDIASESAAAVAGGLTSFMDMPNTNPPTLDAAALQAKYDAAGGRAWGNYGFYLGASNDNLAAIQTLDPKTAPGIKVFMGASTGNMLVDNPQTLDAIFRDAPTPIITHCEDTPTIDATLAAFKEKYGDALTPQMHPDIRSREACLKSSQLAVSLAKKHGTRLHVLHISTADELALFAPGPIQGKRITAETCIHFLRFDRADYATLGNLIKCNPAIKDASDREALIRALAEDVIDVLATDHAPHTWEEKSKPYAQAPSGLPLVQYALVAALELVHEGRLSVAQVVHKFAHAPALLFDVQQRGFLREGYHADLVLIDDTAFTVRREDILSKCGWSPFEGRTFRSRIAATWVNGALAWDGTRLVGSPNGQRLAFDR
ncbi:dihydroorotase [Xanthomonas graminis]|jgi:dihydroorotase|uniref:Dihydroorotase n=1 Tax=Xanthomonas graminis pv. graminis TaxID=134874 RepID=A0A1M4J957_9XANT|nr:dihydroorotase [Xanthomonas translucens]EKU24875.1 Dihydroorotase [Xanthomonas translucens pv. graminis ART-Xtg29]OAX60813.1 dihydroorotase [Xanthomonas translucens pv. graminis]UKE55629.1 dihydroorotase [Xanthomonas translucens pv. graminis]WIH10003.1 dihydroorotase [Xanthomonas translucens pv. graminis]WIH11261.1 dihydroorotase [Xanthomonas translucens pv. graminis]